MIQDGLSRRPPSHRILICGDIAPTPQSLELLSRATATELAPDHADLFAAADLVIANLEAPICASEAQSEKSGPSLRIPPASVAGLKELRITALGLANNHIMDYSEDGLRQTLATLDEAGIAHCGAGACLDQANTPLHFSTNGHTVGLLAVGAQEFGVARQDRPGMSPMDPVNVIPLLTKLRETSDFRIVLVHAGNEGHPFPNPWLQAYCRLLATLGADLVVCQHSHRVGCWERRGDSTLVYGQGNFLMDLPGDTPAFYREGLLLEVELPVAGAGHSIHLHPMRQDVSGCVMRMTTEREADFVADFEHRSGMLSDQEAVAREWREFCRSQADAFKGKLSTSNRVLLKLVYSLGLGRFLVPAKRRLLLQNLIRCQDHREAILTILEEGL